MHLLAGEGLDMDRSITIKIAGKEYPLKVTSPEMEQLMRIAAEAINQKLQAYDSKFPGKDQIDKLAFVTLNEAIARISFQKKLAALEESEKKLLAETQSYLDNIGK